MTDTWRPYEPCNEPTEAPEPEPNADRCAVCGNPRNPHRYRHIFVSEVDAKKRSESTQKKTCKLHRDCRAADEMVRAAGGRTISYGLARDYVVMTAHHEK